MAGKRARAKRLAGEMADTFLSRADARELVGGMPRKQLVTLYLPAAVAMVTLIDAVRKEIQRCSPGPVVVPESLVDDAAARLAAATRFDPDRHTLTLTARKNLGGLWNCCLRSFGRRSRMRFAGWRSTRRLRAILAVGARTHRWRFWHERAGH